LVQPQPGAQNSGGTTAHQRRQECLRRLQKLVNRSLEKEEEAQPLNITN
jgi:hypothetical protein